MQADKLTSIIILAWNQLDFTRLCIKSIKTFTTEPYELILVDNGSTDGTAEYFAELAKESTRVRVITNQENLGFAKGCNQGLAVASGDYLLLLNNDTIVTPGWLGNLLACAESDPKIGIVGPMSNFVSGAQLLEVGYQNVEEMLEFAQSHNRSNPQSWEDVQRLVGFAMLIRSEAYAVVGGLDERFGAGCYEDDDLCVRMSLAGYRLVMAKDTFIHHFGNQTFIGNHLDLTAKLEENHQYFMEKWSGTGGAAPEPHAPSEKEASYYNHVRPEILSLVPMTAQRILDVGCGSGRLGEALKRRQACRVDGVEMFPGAAKEAADRLDQVIEGDVETLELPFKPGSYDCIVCADVLEHLKDPWGTLRKLSGLLAPDGTVVVSLPNVANWEIIQGLLMGRWDYVQAGILDQTHLRFFTRQSCVALLESAGLEVVQSGAVQDRERPEAIACAAVLAKLGFVSPDFEETSRVVQYLFVARKAAAAQAAPKRNSTVSLCMIVKDEEEYLPKCLAAAKPWVDEMVVVDTGSSDRTVEIAEGFGARVLRHAWTGDFAEARNVSLDAATGDWILFLDADEELVAGDGPKLRTLLNQPGVAGWYLNLISFVGDKPGGEAVCNLAFRLFRNHPKHRFTGRLHEQIVAAVQVNGGELSFSDVRVNHYGYLTKPSVEKNKVDRNYQILLREVQDRPEDPFVHFNLGVEHMRLGHHQEALESYQKAFAHLPSLEAAYASILVRNIVLCLINLKRYDEALKVLEDGLAGFPDYTDLLYLKAVVFHEQKDYEKAIEVYKECLGRGESASRHISQIGVGGYKAWNGIGDCLVALGDHREAVKAYTKALQSNRRVLLPVVSLTSILLDHDEPREVLAFLERLTDMSDVDTLAILAHTFGVKGCHEEALDILRLAQKIEPQQRLEFMTGETLLNLGRYAEAVEVFRALPAGSQYRVPALLDQVFCELVTGRFTEAEQCLAEVPGEYAPVSAACRALLDAAAGREPLLTGEEEEMEQTREAVWNLLQKLLEARSFELFEQALALVPAAGIEPGPAALRLGKLYRSQGYDDSAIEELETALTLGEADAESLGILGDICRARGLAEEAVNFYQEAIAHDPSRLVLHTSLVASLATLRQYAEAAAALRSALRHLPSSGLLKETLSSMEALAGSASAVATGADDAS